MTTKLLLLSVCGVTMMHAMEDDAPSSPLSKRNLGSVMRHEEVSYVPSVPSSPTDTPSSSPLSQRKGTVDASGRLSGATDTYYNEVYYPRIEKGQFVSSIPGSSTADSVISFWVPCHQRISLPPPFPFRYRESSRTCYTGSKYQPMSFFKAWGGVIGLMVGISVIRHLLAEKPQSKTHTNH